MITGEKTSTRLPRPVHFITDTYYVILVDYPTYLIANLIYSLFNVVDQDNKYLIINSLIPITEINFNLEDLRSRTRNCLIAKLDKPEDDLIFALILKNFSDRQIIVDKKLIDFIIKRIYISYSKIFEFIYKIDEISLKRKKSIDFKTIKEVLRVNDTCSYDQINEITSKIPNEAAISDLFIVVPDWCRTNW